MKMATPRSVRSRRTPATPAGDDGGAAFVLDLLAQLTGDGAPEEGRSLFGGMLLAAGVGVMLIWSIASLRKRMRRTAAAPSPRERMDALKQRQRDRDSIESVMVDAEELARRLAAHLDNKAARIERLLEDADSAIQRLESLAEQAKASRPGAHSAGGAEAPSAPDPIVRKIYRLSDEGRAPLDIAHELDEQVGKVELVLALRDA